MTLQAPPKRVNKDGQTRCVGVEIEFAGLPPRETAELVRTLFGGELNVVSPHRLQVEGTRWGEFGIELDTNTPTLIKHCWKSTMKATVNGRASSTSGE